MLWLRAEMKPMLFFRDMVHIDTLGVYNNMETFITDNLPHFEVHWEKTIKKANLSVPATAGECIVVSGLRT